MKGADVINVYLPVHNRGKLTSLFIGHLRSLIDDCIELRFWILDDGSTDDTVQLALRKDPSARIISLDGSAYWGGALNKVRSLILERFALGLCNELYMICNDDIRLNRGAMIDALSAVNDNSIVCALCKSEDFCLEMESELSSPNLLPQILMDRFDIQSGRFLLEADPELVNVASTYAMLTTARPWLSSKPIPDSIPHYLSDFWLTHCFWRRGFKIVHPIQFRGITSSTTTRNLPRDYPSYLPQLRLIRVFHRIYLQSLDACTVTSPSFSPAWVEFLSGFSRNPKLGFQLARLWLLFTVGIIIRCFSGLKRG